MNITASTQIDQVARITAEMRAIAKLAPVSDIYARQMKRLQARRLQVIEQTVRQGTPEDLEIMQGICHKEW